MTKARDIATSSVTTADLTAEVGSTIQAHDADLDTISGLAKTDGNVIVGDGTNWVAEDPATVRTSLGLGTAATTAATDYATAAQGATADSALQANQTITLSGDVTGSGTTAITASVAPGSITEAKLSAGAGGADQILTSNGSGTLTWANAAGGGFSNMQVFTGSGTWTNPGSVTKVKVTVVGGGGGGHGKYVSTIGGSAGSGGGGGTAIEVVTIPTAPVAVTVGGGGGGTYDATTGGPTNPIAKVGGDGGTSSFGAYCSATGGTGGYRSRAQTLATMFSPSLPDSLGGVGSGGTINLKGGAGDANRSGDPNYATVKKGGDSALGSGNSYVGGAGSGGYGGGGCSIIAQGPTNVVNPTAASHYNGNAGVVVVEW